MTASDRIAAEELQVSVIVPARDAAATIGDCLDALRAQQIDRPWEVVIVDDGSGDDTAGIARRHPLRPRVIAGPRRGSYAARNAGATSATADVLAFTDADCVPSPGWLAAGVQALQTDADLAGGRIGWIPGSTGIPARYDQASYLRQQDYVGGQQFAATANLFIRAETFHSLGGFDDGLRSGGDVEFGTRASAAGLRLVYAPDAVVLHQPRSTYRELWQLHRRLGAGWAALARRGQRPPWWRDGALRSPTLGMVVEHLPESGAPIRRRRLLAAHLTVRTARVVGRLTGR